MNYRLVAFILVLLPAICAMAQDFESLCFKLTNGEGRTFAFREKPTITFDKDNYHVNTATENVVIGRDEVVSYYFLTLPVSVVTDELPNLLVRRISNDFLRVEGAPAGCRVSVWNAAGQCCLTLTTGEDGTAAVNLAKLVTGTYIVSIGECQTLKIVKQ